MSISVSMSISFSMSVSMTVSMSVSVPMSVSDDWLKFAENLGASPFKWVVK
jgi:hypothetical protein